MSETEQTREQSDTLHEHESLLKKHYYAFEVIVLIFAVLVLFSVFALYSNIKNNRNVATDVPAVTSEKCQYASNGEALQGAIERGSINDCDCIDDVDTKSMCVAQVNDLFFYKKAVSDVRASTCDFIEDTLSKESCQLAVEDKVAYAKSLDTSSTETDTDTSVDFEKAYQENSNDVETILQLAVSYGFKSAENGTEESDATMISKSLALIEEAKKIAPNDSKVYMTEGFVYGLEKEYDKAIEAYSKSLELDANNIQALINRGKVYELMDMTTEATADFDKARQLDTNNVYSKYL